MAEHAAVVGTQWGDEGKGKVVDFLTRKSQVVVRYQGGTNAGHTVVVGREKYALHLIPSGILHSDKTCLIGDGVIVHPETLVRELGDLRKRVSKTARLLLSTKVQLIMPWHIARDGIAGGLVGTTKRGIGPCYADATARRGIRVMELDSPKHFKGRVKYEANWNKRLIKAMADSFGLSSTDLKGLKLSSVLNHKKVAEDYLSQFRELKELGVEITDGSAFLWEQDRVGKKILFEGAQATLLDITHGDYPYVTSSHPTIGGLYIGAGFRPRKIGVTGVAKAYSTRVGNGPFPTEIDDSVAEGLRSRGNEYGTTTGRPRRCGWLDLVTLRYAARVNGLDGLAVTKLDILSGIKKLKVAVAYKLGKKRLVNYPADVKKLEKCQPIYKTLEGWDEDITGVRKLKDLPKAAQNYLKFVEKDTGVPVAFVGVGPGRQQMIKA